MSPRPKAAQRQTDNCHGLRLDFDCYRVQMLTRDKESLSELSFLDVCTGMQYAVVEFGGSTDMSL